MGLEDQHRFTAEGWASAEDGQLLLRCDRCSEVVVVTDEPLSLADLNDRAGEHAEVCR